MYLSLWLGCVGSGSSGMGGACSDSSVNSSCRREDRRRCLGGHWGLGDKAFGMGPSCESWGVGIGGGGCATWDEGDGGGCV